jgi:SWI/SNF-related matrix-associated actin-dependent regulator 1 of chromatin subfamily A
VLQEVSSWSDFQLHQFAAEHEPVLGDFTLAPSALMQSGKFAVLERLLLALREVGSRALVFSQWTSVLDIMQWFLDEVRARLPGPPAGRPWPCWACLPAGAGPACWG